MISLYRDFLLQKFEDKPNDWKVTIGFWSFDQPAPIGSQPVVTVTMGQLRNPVVPSQLKPCPLCGHRVDLTDPDTLYPNGILWRMHPEGFVHYGSGEKFMIGATEADSGKCYSLHCVTTSGGCGMEVHGDSRDEAIQKWETRVLQPTS